VRDQNVDVDPSLFYTGVVAEMYGRLRSVPSDAEPYARFIARSGEPALELGCGDGEPLLELRRRGLDVEGLDSSPDMLDRCRLAAERLGLPVVLHLQAMQTMDLARRYRSIFLAGPTFNLLPDDDTAVRALKAIAGHLEPDGTALIPLFIPTRTPIAHLGVSRTALDADNTTLRFTVLSESRDDTACVQVSLLRYERVLPERVVVEERPWLLHWHTQPGFTTLAIEAGLRTRAILNAEGVPANTDDAAFSFLLERGA
jgi:SAM-dependent methyltransferase